MAEISHQRDDEVGTEPIVFLAFIEQDLESADAQRQKRYARCNPRALRRPSARARNGGSSTMR